MQQILRHFSTPSPEYPWAILQDVLKTTEVLLDQLETRMRRQDQLSQASQLNDNLMVRLVRYWRRLYGLTSYSFSIMI